MRTDNMAAAGRVAALAAGLALFVGSYLILVRPWHLQWGATPIEAATTLPGDELLVAREGSTRAITIEAPAALVWQWLRQLGQDRGGFFSYELLEDLVGAEMENRSALDPRFPEWAVGDKLWMYPPDKLNGAGHAVLLQVDPGRSLVFGTWQFGTDMKQPSNGLWVFVVQPSTERRTRLIVRGRAAGERAFALAAFDRLLFEPMHFVMERKMLAEIKARAEGSAPTPVADALLVFLFVAAFVNIVAACVWLLRWPSLRLSFAALVASTVAFQVVTFLQPHWTVALAIVVGCAALQMRLRSWRPQLRAGQAEARADLTPATTATPSRDDTATHARVSSRRAAAIVDSTFLAREARGANVSHPLPLRRHTLALVLAVGSVYRLQATYDAVTTSIASELALALLNALVHRSTLVFSAS